MAREEAITVNVERQRRLSPCEALVVYQEQNDPYMTPENREVIHFEIDAEGAFVKPRALSIGHLNDIFNSPDRSGALEYLDPRILARSNTGIAWYEPPRRAEILFEVPEKERRDLNDLCKGKKIFWPALLFKLTDGELYCRALNSGRRPTPETKLFVVPLTHIEPATGRVCLPRGLKSDAALPMTDNMRNFSENFYSGVFGHMTGGEVTTHPGGHDGLWREILRAPRAKRFPTQYLKEADQTLRDFLR